MRPISPNVGLPEESLAEDQLEYLPMATVPAPALLGERMWDPERSKKAYPKREDFVRDCVPILHREVELLRVPGTWLRESNTRP